MNDVAFDKQYYDNIWGSVHRHDYCESLADELIAKYNPDILLDIGTGCGYLVKILREKGVQAYGIDISPYAVKSSHGNVLLADVRNIPFKDNLFDVVHSNGLWGYFEEIPKALAECKRVGKIQHHNIDYAPQPPEHKYLFTETQQWWQEQGL